MLLETSIVDLNTTQNEDSQEYPKRQAKLSDEKMKVDIYREPEAPPKTAEKPTAPAATKYLRI